MEELLGIIGRLYVDMYNTQKYIESLQKQLKDKDSEIAILKGKLIPKDNKTEIINE